MLTSLSPSPLHSCGKTGTIAGRCPATRSFRDAKNTRSYSIPRFSLTTSDAGSRRVWSTRRRRLRAIREPGGCTSIMSRTLPGSADANFDRRQPGRSTSHKLDGIEPSLRVGSPPIARPWLRSWLRSGWLMPVIVGLRETCRYDLQPLSSAICADLRTCPPRNGQGRSRGSIHPLGTWRWVDSIGDLLPARGTPQSCDCVRLLILGSNGSYRHFWTDSSGDYLLAEGSFSVQAGLQDVSAGPSSPRGGGLDSNA